MKYKVDDRIKIKSLDWYNENKDEDGDVPDNSMNVLFLAKNKWCCGKEFVIKQFWDGIESYAGKRVYELYGCEGQTFTDYMIEGLVEDSLDKVTQQD